MADRVRDALRVYAGCLALATGMCLYFIRLLYGAVNRQVFLWGRADTLALFLDIALAALLLAGGHALLGLLAGASRRRMLLEWLFPVAVTAVGLQANPLPERWNVVWGAGWSAVAMGLWIGMAFPRFRALRIPEKCLLVLFLLYWVLLGGLLAVPSLAPSAVPAGGQVADGVGDGPMPGADGAPVWVVFADAVDCDACVEPDGSWRPGLTNLCAMARESVSFSRAFSGGINTFPSMPNFVFQDSMVACHPDLDEARDWTDACLAWRNRPVGGDLFGMAAETGHATAFVTSYLPWALILPTVPDRLWVCPFTRYVRSEAFWARMANAAAYTVYFFRGLDLVSKRLVRCIRDRFCLNRARYVLDGFAEMRSIAAGFPPRMFVVAHTGATHDDVFLPTGGFSPGASHWDELRFADAQWGRIADILRARGLYDKAWIVFTSDHNHRHDGRRVPLLVKPPGGLAGPVRSDEEVRLWEMEGFFRRVFAGEAPEACLAELGVASGAD